MQSTGVVRLICFPRPDASSAAAAERAFAQCGPSVTPEALEQALRTAYPDVRAMERNDLAVLGGTARTSYVYRDGGLLSDPTEQEGRRAS